MIVHAQGLFTHILDIGLSHEPCCHILLNADAISLPLEPNSARLVALPPPLLPTEALAAIATAPKKAYKGAESVLTVDLTTLNLVPLVVTPALLLRAFRSGFGTSKATRHLDNQLAIVHYVRVHMYNNILLNEVSQTQFYIGQSLSFFSRVPVYFLALESVFIKKPRHITITSVGTDL